MRLRHWLGPADDHVVRATTPETNSHAGNIDGTQRSASRPVAAIMARAMAIRNRKRNLPERVNLAPDPAITTEPVIQVYGARCLGWRGYFSLHTWIAVKPAGAKAYTIYEVTPEALARRGCCVSTRRRAPDAHWYGAAPQLLADKRGDEVGPLIERLRQAVKVYRYAGKYVMFPGPNSNTFIAHLARLVPELEIELPCNAIGKDYLGLRSIGRPASGTGFQFSLFGLLGILVSRVEGIEINVLGLSCGINPFGLCVKLPLIGHLGASRFISAHQAVVTPDAPEAAD